MKQSSIKQYLAEQDFFASLKSEYLDFLADCATARQIEPDEVLFLYGNKADRFFLLRSGRISIEVAAIEGPPLELQKPGAGEVLGWSWLIEPYQWHFQARAEQPGEVFEFDGKKVFERCEKDPAFGYALLKRFSGLMSKRLDFAREKMKEEWSPAGFA